MNIDGDIAARPVDPMWAVSRIRIHMRQMAQGTALTILLGVAAISNAAEKADRVVVKKSEARLYLERNGSYPNAQDIASAKARGVAPGGFIMVHGQKNGFGWLAPLARRFNWTDGCVAVSNEDMDIIWQTVDVGTPIEILP